MHFFFMGVWVCRERIQILVVEVFIWRITCGPIVYQRWRS
jgi:hypothetical protein